MVDLVKLEELAKAATPGPWESDASGAVFVVEQRCCGKGYSECCGEPDIDLCKLADSGETDAKFIAAANPSAVLELIAALTSAKAEIERLSKALTPFLCPGLNVEKWDGGTKIYMEYPRKGNAGQTTWVTVDQIIEARAAAAMGEEPRT